jgi:hypothetical protein
MKPAFLTFALICALANPALAGNLRPSEESQSPALEDATGGSLGPATIGALAVVLLVASGGSTGGLDESGNFAQGTAGTSGTR